MSQHEGSNFPTQDVGTLPWRAVLARVDYFNIWNILNIREM